VPLGDVAAKDDDCICNIEKMVHIAMPKWTQAMRGTHLPEIVLGNKVVIGLAYVAGYVLLDRISFIEPYASFGITPWNPNTGLSFALVLIFGLRMIPLLFVSAFMADLMNRQIGVPWAVEAIWVALIGGGYSTALAYLKRSRTRFDPALSSMRDLVLLILVAAASAAFVASTYVGVAIATGLLSIKDFAPATLRYWIGDAVGILALTPLALFVLTRRRILPLSVETALQFAAIAAALLAVFGLSQEREFQLFYLLFLPIVWMAVRNGTEGVSAGILITQFGLILGVGLFPDERKELAAFQALMLVLAVTGLVAGELVTERRRMESQLRLQQESLARVARFGSVGELAAAVAHEINQPLMAAGTYIRLVADTISSGNIDTGEVAETAKKAAAQVDRAAQVIRRLRALVRLDRSNRAPVRFERIVKGIIELCKPDLDRARIAAHAHLAAGLPPVLVDVLQIEQVVLNLVRNSIEAISDSGGTGGSIWIEARRADDDFIEVHVLDSGPGFPRERIETGPLPLSSSKAYGLGVGLPLCTSIVEAHGGRLWLEPFPRGASVHFTIPTTDVGTHTAQDRRA
jgi:two-component system sensor kinase FixL